MEYTIDALKLNDRDSAHDYLAEVFEFPEYYGKNLDAFYDSLGEMNIDKIYVQNSEKGEFYFFAIMEIIEELEIEVEYI